jgi:hypothetical protein
VRLLEFGRDFQVLVEGASQHGRYKALFELVPKPSPEAITRERLEAYVGRLRTAYPDRGFRLDAVLTGGRLLHVITRPSYDRLPDGTRRQARLRVPIYFDLEAQKVLVPQWYVRNRRRLMGYVLMRTLGSLGYAHVKYLRIQGRREGAGSQATAPE